MSLALFAGFYVSREHCCLHWFYRMNVLGRQTFAVDCPLVESRWNLVNQCVTPATMC